MALATGKIAGVRSMIVFLEHSGILALTDERIEQALSDAAAAKRQAIETALADAVFRGVQALLEGDEAASFMEGVAREFQVDCAPLSELFHLRPSEWHMLRNARRLAQRNAVVPPMVRVTTCAVCGIGIGIGYREHNAFVHFPHQRWNQFTRVRVRSVAPICEDCLGRRMRSDDVVASIIDRFIARAHPEASSNDAASLRRRILQDPLLASTYRSTWRVIDFNRFYADDPDGALKSVWSEYVFRMSTWEQRLCDLNLVTPQPLAIPSSKPTFRRSSPSPHQARASA